VKTAKSIEVTQRALDAPTGAITVSTLREAEYFFDHGFRDILYAVGMVPAKVARVAELTRRGANVSTIVDSVEGARALRQACDKAGLRIPRSWRSTATAIARASLPGIRRCSRWRRCSATRFAA